MKEFCAVLQHFSGCFALILLCMMHHVQQETHLDYRPASQAHTPFVYEVTLLQHMQKQAWLCPAENSHRLPGKSR